MYGQFGCQWQTSSVGTSSGGRLFVCAPPTSMIWYTWRLSILSERNYRNLFQLPQQNTSKANTTFSIDHLSSQALAHSHHSIRVGGKVTALFSRNYGFLRVRFIHGQSRLNNNNREILIGSRHQTRRWTHRLDWLHILMVPSRKWYMQEHE